MQTIITTTGISLLSNTARDLIKKNSEVTDTELQQYFIKVGASEASAETNSLLKIATPNDKVVLLYTTTPEGERCMKQVHRYLENQGWSKIISRKLPLEKNESQFERHGLRELVNILVDEINRAQSKHEEVIINATGGFKAEISYTTMVGMIFQVPVKYIYQDFQKPITFPALPIAWNIDLLLEYEHFFEWIDSEPRQKIEVEQRLKAIPDKNSILQLLLPPDTEDDIYLSPAGAILWQRVNQQKKLAEITPEPPASENVESEKISSSLKGVKHHFPDGTKTFAEKLAKIPAVEEIISGNFENTTLKRVKRIFDDGSILVLWADNTKAVRITIRTTARGQAETLKIRDNYIQPLLDS
jgi:putative CRISPR-associated protein (TIGR02619 family)